MSRKKEVKMELPRYHAGTPEVAPAYMDRDWVVFTVPIKQMPIGTSREAPAVLVEVRIDPDYAWDFGAAIQSAALKQLACRHRDDPID